MSDAPARRGMPRRLLRAVSVTAGMVMLAASGLALAPAAQAESPSSRLVDSWYNRFLGRVPDAQGSRYWEDQLARRSPEDVLRELTRTREYATRKVTGLYRWYLEREPDQGARYWIDGLQQGRFRPEWVEQSIVASPEYASLLLRSSFAASYDWRGDPALRDRAILIQNYVDAAFGTGAPPNGSRDAITFSGSPRVLINGGDLSYWLDDRWPTDRLGLLRAIWYEDAAVDERIERAYMLQLAREPNAGETAYWRGPERASDDEVMLLIASSPEHLRCVETCFGRGS